MSVEVIFCTDCRRRMRLGQDYAGILCRACALRHNPNVCHACRGYAKISRLAADEFGAFSIYEDQPCEACGETGLVRTK